MCFSGSRATSGKEQECLHQLSMVCLSVQRTAARCYPFRHCQCQHSAAPVLSLVEPLLVSPPNTAHTGRAAAESTGKSVGMQCLVTSHAIMAAPPVGQQQSPSRGGHLTLQLQVHGCVCCGHQVLNFLAPCIPAKTAYTGAHSMTSQQKTRQLWLGERKPLKQTNLSQRLLQQKQGSRCQHRSLGCCQQTFVEYSWDLNVSL